jgi:hypothetical protein
MILCVVFLAGTNNAIAQKDTMRFCPSAIYVEVFGQGIFYSVNYDYRLSRMSVLE